VSRSAPGAVYSRRRGGGREAARRLRQPWVAPRILHHPCLGPGRDAVCGLRGARAGLCMRVLAGLARQLPALPALTKLRSWAPLAWGCPRKLIHTTPRRKVDDGDRESQPGTPPLARAEDLGRPCSPGVPLSSSIGGDSLSSSLVAQGRVCGVAWRPLETRSQLWLVCVE
jgi:hypothetical protein